MGFGKVLKEKRVDCGETQQQLSQELNVTRESISAYENERIKIPADISKKLVKKYDDPFFDMQLANEVTGTIGVVLNGENVDIHRSSVREKTIEEMKEALDSIEATSVANSPKSISSFERENLEVTIQTSIDVVVALTHFIGILCIEYEISWNEMWDRHFAKLIAKGFVKC